MGRAFEEADLPLLEQHLLVPIDLVAPLLLKGGRLRLALRARRVELREAEFAERARMGRGERERERAPCVTAKTSLTHSMIKYVESRMHSRYAAHR